MREKRVRRRKKSYFYQTTMKFTICVAPSVVLSLDFWTTRQLGLFGRSTCRLKGADNIHSLANALHVLTIFSYFIIIFIC
jgi:hypothetical protein